MVISRIYNKLNFDIIFNLVLVLVIIFSKNYLEEDLIIGLFSSIVLFLIFFILKEQKSQELRELRLNIKKIYRVQKDLLSVYYFFHRLLKKRYFKYTRNILKKVFNIKIKKAFININLKLKTFFSKLIFIKLLTLNILVNLVLKENLRILNIC